MLKKYGSEALLLVVALIWGTSFVTQKTGMDFIGPLTFNATKLWLGGITLLPLLAFLSIKNKEKQKIEKAGKTGNELADEKRTLIIGGVACGVALLVASTFQQTGIVYTTAGKAGFITSLYIVLVPLFGFFIGKKIRLILLGSVVLATVGLYLLSFTAGSPINIGDVIMLGSAVGYAAHILVIDHFATKTDAIKMSIIQFFVAGALATPIMFIFEDPQIGNILDAWFPLFYTGCISAGVAYTLQIIAQKNVEPALASLILSLESVLAVLAGIILIGESISTKETIGCVIMFVAIILAQVPSKEERIEAKSRS